jgi:Sec-independent protein translocase protein TatA
MFGLGWLELSIVALLLLLVIGSGRFPGAARQAGQAAGFVQKYRKQWLMVKRFLRLG